MKLYKGYKYRIYPTQEQKILLSKHFGSARWVYNYGLFRKIEHYAKEKKTLSRFEIQKDIVKLKKKEETKWLAEVNAQSLQESLINLDKAYTRFFREKKGFPNFKSKKNKQSVSFTQGTKIDFEKKKVYVMKFREGIKCKFSRTFEGKIKTTTISKTTTNKYFVSILVKQEVKKVKKLKPKIKKAMGIDLGLKSFLVTSNGHTFDNPKFFKKSLKKLKRGQRKFSRKKKGSNNRNKQRIRVALIHEKVTNQRKDFLHKISRQLINDNQVNTYCIENLNVAGMLKNHCLAQSISDVGWSIFTGYLSYKAEWAGKSILQIGRFAPSSKLCNVCGNINNELTLKNREWSCPKCKTKHNRDFLAACNIRDFAFDKQNKIGRGTPEFTLGEIGSYSGLRTKKLLKETL